MCFFPYVFFFQSSHENLRDVLAGWPGLLGPSQLLGHEVVLDGEVSHVMKLLCLK